MTRRKNGRVGTCIDPLTGKREASDSHPPDNGCPDWGEAFASCLRCPISVCREDDPKKARAEAVKKGLIQPGKPETLMQKRAAVKAALDAGMTPTRIAEDHAIGVPLSTIQKWASMWRRRDSFPLKGAPKLDEREAVAQLLAQGMTRRAAAATVGVTPTTIARWFRRPEPDTYAAKRVQAEALIRQGMLQKDVAALIGIKRTTISAWTIKGGWRPNTRDESRANRARLQQAYADGLSATEAARSVGVSCDIAYRYFRQLRQAAQQAA